MSSYLLSVGVIWGAVLVLASLTVLAWRQQPQRAAALFAVAMFCGTWWATTSAFGLFSAADGTTMFWTKVQWVGIVFVPVAWLLFALEYTGRERYVTREFAAALSVLPTVTLALALTNDYHLLVYESVSHVGVGPLTVLDVEFGPWFWAHSVYSYGLLVLGTAFIVQLAVGKRGLYRDHVVALLGIVTPPVLGGVLYISGVGPFETLDPTPYSFVLSGVAGIAALRRYRFLDVAPVTDRIARKSLVDEMEEAVVVVDANDRVVEMNPRARSLFSVAASPVGRDATSCVPHYDEIPTDDSGSRETVAIQRDGHERIYEVRITDLASGRSQRSGTVLVFHDVTEQRTRLQRLDVLNRVLRHNLRNEMNVVYGYADRIETADDPTVREEMAGRVKEKTMAMVELGDRARAIDALLENGDEPDEYVPLDAILEWERNRVTREYPAVRVEWDGPGSTAVCSTALETILAVLVDVVLEHNDAEDPLVGIDATVDGANARIAVAADGTTIPPIERRAIESGEESDLRHGRGLDLWLVNWGAQAVGGDLVVTDPAPGDPVAEITVPCERPVADRTTKD